MIGYTLKGEIIDPNVQECYAKETETTSKEYFIRIDRSIGGSLFDPTDKNSNGGQVVRGSIGPIEKFPFIKVNKICFENYLNFLKTSHRAHLLNANRSIGD